MMMFLIALLALVQVIHAVNISSATTFESKSIWQNKTFENYNVPFILVPTVVQSFDPIQFGYFSKISCSNATFQFLQRISVNETWIQFTIQKMSLYCKMDTMVWNLNPTIESWLQSEQSQLVIMVPLFHEPENYFIVNETNIQEAFKTEHDTTLKQKQFDCHSFISISNISLYDPEGTQSNFVKTSIDRLWSHYRTNAEMIVGERFCETLTSTLQTIYRVLQKLDMTSNQSNSLQIVVIGTVFGIWLFVCIVQWIVQFLIEYKYHHLRLLVNPFSYSSNVQNSNILSPLYDENNDEDFGSEESLPNDDNISELTIPTDLYPWLNPKVSIFWKIVMGPLIWCTIGLFGLSHWLPGLSVSLHFFGENALTSQFTLQTLSTIQFATVLWNVDGMRVFSFFIVLLTGVVPYVKMLFLIRLWMWKQYQPTETRHFLATSWISKLVFFAGKWSIVEFFMIAFMMGFFQMSWYRTGVESHLLIAVLQIHPESGLYCYLMATAISTVLTHFLIDSYGSTGKTVCTFDHFLMTKKWLQDLQSLRTKKWFGILQKVMAIGIFLVIIISMSLIPIVSYQINGAMPEAVHLMGIDWSLTETLTVWTLLLKLQPVGFQILYGIFGIGLFITKMAIWTANVNGFSCFLKRKSTFMFFANGSWLAPFVIALVVISFNTSLMFEKLTLLCGSYFLNDECFLMNLQVHVFAWILALIDVLLDIWVCCTMFA